MHTVNVSLGDRSYPIYIGRGLLDRPELLQRHIPGKKVLVVTNETIAPLYLDRWEPNGLCSSLITSKCRSLKVPCTSATADHLPQLSSCLSDGIIRLYGKQAADGLVIGRCHLCAGACRPWRRAASTTLRQLCCQMASNLNQSRF